MTLRGEPHCWCLPLALVVIELAACGGEEPEPSAATPHGVSASVSESVATVVRVEWATDEPTTGYVRFGPTDDLAHRTPTEAEPTREHSRVLLGLTADTRYLYEVVSVGTGATSGVGSIETGPLPGGMPTLTRRGDGHDLFTVVPVLGATTAVLILDPQGRVVWYHQDDRALDFYRARLSRDGSSLLYNAASVSGDPADDSELVRVSLDGSSSSSVAVPLLAHDFVELPDGTLAAIAVEYIEFDGTSLRSDGIVEIDPAGEVSEVWHATDCFDPAEVQGDDSAQGWTLANALDYDDAEDAYYLGMRNLGSITKIDRASGACQWVLGGAASTFDFAAGSARFLHQHQFDVVGNHILVFDNDGSLESESRVLEYELDFDASIATEVWSYVAQPAVSSFVLGEATRLQGGDTFVNWSMAGQLERVTAAGESIWQLNTGVGFAFGFHTLAESLYGRGASSPP